MEKISIDLSIAEWNVIIHALSRQPYAEVFQVINEIKRQADAKLMTPVDENVT